MISVVALSACGGSTDTSASDNNMKSEDNSSKSNEKDGNIKAETISTEELQNHIDDANWIVVDTRINDAFNGWKLDGVARGGHIEGATDFAVNWLTVEDENKEVKLEEVLEDKGIVSDKNIVLYDANGKDAKAVSEYLLSKDFKNLYIYDVKEWASDENLPMESYANYEMLVPAQWVNEVIETNNNEKDYKIFEVSWGEVSEAYKAGHIPGAIHINTDEVEEGPMWNRKSDEELLDFALNNGINTDTTVIVYGADSTAASRVAVILKYMGVKDVRLVNGGLKSWENAGFEIEKEENEKEAIDNFGADVPQNPNYIIDLAEAKELLADKENGRLVDIRSWEEYIGETSGYDYIDGKGRPEGAVWGHAGTDPYHLQDFRNIDNTMRNESEILTMWEEWEITPDKNMAFYCGTGWRAAEVLFYADVMGFENISLYDGGWNEWSVNPENPIEVGKPNNTSDEKLK
ncbi:MAG: sulfurtransferase [Firmicutes bacterium]|nr:sulfurtransferase [Bacillota bacterium]